MVGIHEVTFRAWDSNLNEDFCSFTIEVLDEQSPGIICPDDMIVYANEADSAKEFDILMHNYIVDDEHHHPADFMVAIKYLIDDVLVEKPYIRIAEKLIKDLENNKYGK